MLISNIMFYTISLSTNSAFVDGAEVLGGIDIGLFVNHPLLRLPMACVAQRNPLGGRLHHVRSSRQDCDYQCTSKRFFTLGIAARALSIALAVFMDRNESILKPPIAPKVDKGGANA